MMANDPTKSKFSHTNNPMNTVNLKQPVALQAMLGHGGSLNRNYSKSSGLNNNLNNS